VRPVSVVADEEVSAVEGRPIEVTLADNQNEWIFAFSDCNVALSGLQGHAHGGVQRGGAALVLFSYNDLRRLLLQLDLDPLPHRTLASQPSLSLAPSSQQCSTFLSSMSRSFAN